MRRRQGFGAQFKAWHASSKVAKQIPPAVIAQPGCAAAGAGGVAADEVTEAEVAADGVGGGEAVVMGACEAEGALRAAVAHAPHSTTNERAWA